MKIVIQNKYGTFKIIRKQLLWNKVVPAPEPHFWDELTFIAVNGCSGYSDGSGNWNGLKLTWLDKQTVRASNRDFKGYLHFFRMTAPHCSLLKITILPTLKELSDFDSERSQNFLNLLFIIFQPKHGRFQKLVFFLHEKKSLRKSQRSENNISRKPCFPSPKLLDGNFSSSFSSNPP